MRLPGSPICVRLARLETTGSNVEISIDDLMPSDVILISAGEQIPVDGRVLEGQGLVDERLIRGVHGLNRKGPEDVVLAGSTLRFGELQVEVVRQGPQTRAAGLARAIRAVTMPASELTSCKPCEEKSSPNERSCPQWPLPVWDF